jgi:hypothetical protein
MRRLPFLGVFLLAAGCSGGLAAVSGTVTLDGQPAAGVSVTFQPAEGTQGGSYATTDAQGRYTLKRVADDRSGAAVGKHKVVLSMSKQAAGNAESASLERLPARYNTKSDLTFDVPSGGTSDANFELKSK